MFPSVPLFSKVPRKSVRCHVMVLGCWDPVVKQEVTRISFVQRSLCESEQARVQAARKHTLVWALRQKPPADWNLPLPPEKDK